MKNVNYNLIKMLHNTLDDLWRIQKYYARDAKKLRCPGCIALYKNMEKDIKNHLGLLQTEVKNHIQKKKFN